MTDASAPPAPDDIGAPAARRRAEIDWEGVRRAYVSSDMAVSTILSTFRVGKGEFYRRAGLEAWPMRQPGMSTADAVAEGRARRREPSDRAVLVERLFRAVERQIGEIETRLKLGEAPVDEKDARTLAALARTVELLIGLEKRGEGEAGNAEVDIDVFREDLARRIAGLRHGG